ncbi:hypothetical protein ARMGADRAFT_1087839 [Armillaria gallica]|uniref:Uncharacterized protein n=1 Tax=Armillaria gallica TaxID=47427 RepID=A0A2H3D316_ARMGA|nr:hypothetical protein ARMGADRAFT_1087839 [Armillaria gallica]
MRAHSKPSVPRLDAYANKSSSSQPRFIFWPDDSLTLHLQRWPLLNRTTLRLGSTRQRAGDGLRGSQEHFAGVERDGRAVGVLDSPTAVVFYTAETFQDEHLAIKHYWFRRCPHYAAAVQRSQI